MHGLDVPRFTRPAAASRAEPQQWRILDAGDTVCVDGRGIYEIIHVSEGKAWVCGVSDGEQLLVDAARVVLMEPLCGCDLQPN